MLFWKILRDFEETSPVMAILIYFFWGSYFCINIFANGLTLFNSFFLLFHLLTFSLIDFFDNDIAIQRFTSFLGPGINVEKLVIFFFTWADKKKYSIFLKRYPFCYMNKYNKALIFKLFLFSLINRFLGMLYK